MVFSQKKPLKALNIETFVKKTIKKSNDFIRFEG